MAYQFIELDAYLKRLRDLIGQGTATAVKRVKGLGEGFNRLKAFTNSTLEDLAGLMTAEIAKLTPHLTADLTTDTLLGSVAGATGVVSRLPSTLLGLLLKAPKTSLVAFKTVHPEEGAGKAELPTLTEVLFPSTEPAITEVHLPALQIAVETIQAAPVKLGANYKETAEHVKKGAFAITADMEQKAVEDVRNELTKAITEGKSQSEFIDVVSKRLAEEGNPLSPPHIENVFRTNTMAAYSNAQYKAVNDPLVSDGFPYAGYTATHDERVRNEHLELESLGLNGTNIYRMEDPTFILFRPPFSWNCRCSWYPQTVEQAARKGVQEAKDWLQRAKDRVKEKGGTFYQYLNETQPLEPKYVTPPNFKPDPNFDRSKV